MVRPQKGRKLSRLSLILASLQLGKNPFPHSNIKDALLTLLPGPIMSTAAEHPYESLNGSLVSLCPCSCALECFSCSTFLSFDLSQQLIYYYICV